jgi:hypothetical protein
MAKKLINRAVDDQGLEHGGSGKDPDGPPWALGAPISALPEPHWGSLEAPFGAPREPIEALITMAT